MKILYIFPYNEKSVQGYFNHFGDRNILFLSNKDASMIQYWQQKTEKRRSFLFFNPIFILLNQYREIGYLARKVVEALSSDSERLFVFISSDDLKILRVILNKASETFDFSTHVRENKRPFPAGSPYFVSETLNRFRTPKVVVSEYSKAVLKPVGKRIEGSLLLLEQHPN